MFWVEDRPLTVAFAQHTIPAMNYSKEVTEGLMVKGRVGDGSFPTGKLTDPEK